jgi:hypothetical protein
VLRVLIEIIEKADLTRRKKSKFRPGSKSGNTFAA